MTAPLPLTGIRVAEFCNVAAGPYCCMLLGDFGADVIKVENPDGGDTMRAWPPQSRGYSENFASVNRNKRSVVLDLKSAEGLAEAKRIIASCDVLVENNRPGVMDRLGLGYAELSKLRPGLIYCSISAFGQDGPRAKEGGFDLTMQAMAGVMSVTGEPDGAPVKCGVPLSDFSAGLYAAMSICALLRQVQSGGEGGHIDISMQGAVLAVSALQTSEYFGNGKDPKKLGSAHPRNAPYQAFRAQDGWFAMAAGTHSLWVSAARAAGRPDLAEDPRFANTALRAANQDALRDLLEEAFATRTVEQMLDAFRDAGVPCAPINSTSQALSDIQVEHMGWVQPLTLPNGVETRTFASPVRIDGASLPITRPPPALGQHGEEIVKELKR
jgi:crotonobetainyl-CoA:carnitine CoA-transferase CaiB-like acyl-CoA transferase